MSFYNYIEFSQKFLGELQKDPEISSLFLHIDNDRFNLMMRNILSNVMNPTGVMQFDINHLACMPCHKNFTHAQAHAWIRVFVKVANECQFESKQINKIVSIVDKMLNIDEFIVSVRDMQEIIQKYKNGENIEQDLTHLCPLHK